MDDYIKREDALKMRFTDGIERDCIVYVPLKDVISHLKSIPAAEVVEVVRCRDCKYWNANLKQCFHKTAPGMWRKESFFCANGERETRTNG